MKGTWLIKPCTKTPDRKKCNIEVPFILYFSRGEQIREVKGHKKRKFNSFTSIAKGKSQN